MSLQSKTPLAKDIPCGPQPLRACLVFLEDVGHERVKLHLHEVKRKEEAASHYDVKVSEVAALEVKPVADNSKASIKNIGNLVKLSALKASPWVQIVHKLQFDPASNKIMSGYPGVYVKQPIRVKTSEVFKLC